MYKLELWWIDIAGILKFENNICMGLYDLGMEVVLEILSVEPEYVGSLEICTYV